MPYYTTCNISVRGKAYRAGQRLPDDCPPGILESMARLGQMVEQDAPPKPDMGATANGETESPATGQARPPDTPEKPLTKMNKKQLQAIATELEIPFTEETNKQLIRLIEKARA